MTIKEELAKHSSKEKAQIYTRFFKTGKGEYGFGDKFLGVIVPTQRKIAKKHMAANYQELQELLNSKYHEHRLTALIILTLKYEKQENQRQKIFDFYTENIDKINNWDLIDVTSPKIIGRHTYNQKNPEILFKLSKSENLWRRRIAIISTHYYIKQKRYDETIQISKTLLKDKHDLIHKAVGWMLREVGKQNKSKLIQFLDEHSKEMPRTMLRYSIEKLQETQRKHYLAK